MEQHLLSSVHREFVSIVNGSVPVVVRRQTSLICQNCSQRFRYNFQLRFHMRETGHDGSLTSSDEYQNRIPCGLCSQVVRSQVALQRHQLSSHAQQHGFRNAGLVLDVQPTAPYFCSFCSMNFVTASEAVLHRRTLSHKEMVRACKLSSKNITDLAWECPHCGAEQSDLVKHKEHLLQQHPQLCHRLEEFQIYDPTMFDHSAVVDESLS